jgi:hypothetical protein
MPDCYGGHRPCSTAVSTGARINRSAGDYGRTANHTKPQKDGPQT